MLQLQKKNLRWVSEFFSALYSRGIRILGWIADMISCISPKDKVPPGAMGAIRICVGPE
ncbi:MAG: hypothetical protein CM1200mP3_03840 [Chloroflexota bacterium]|nr:MAG: hypothetical protein CM1200mP3_03840 [Chloroflexota bacterium]